LLFTTHRHFASDGIWILISFQVLKALYEGTAGMENKLFLSYSDKDSAFTDRLIHALKQKGNTIWFNRQDLRGGDAWRAATTNAIRHCKAFLLVITPASSQSLNVIRELSIAERNHRPIIPILYGIDQIPSSMEFQIAHLHVIDFTHMSFDEALEMLNNAVIKLIPQNRDSSATPDRSITEHRETSRKQNWGGDTASDTKKSRLSSSLISALSMLGVFSCCFIIWLINQIYYPWY
jgi:hypothetical protein